ncbi:MAG TPA: ribonuclease III, partial [Pyrinomonadaceae bacterium]|nr:ribonuclease III [Pyrinomonadaceae bacterium]
MKASANNSQHQDLLETALAYSFENRALLERAMTHRSWAHEQVAPGNEEQARQLHNEALEFLGDSVLGLIVADYLCRSHPEVTEGELSRMKHRLVSAPTLAQASLRLRLGDFLRFGRGEEKSGGRSKDALLADVLEAVTGAIFLDGGLAAATEFVHRAIGDELKQANPAAAAEADYKTMLQEKLQA